MSKPRFPGLTPKQIEHLSFIRSYIAEKGYAPTIREMKEHHGLGSPGPVLAMLGRLVERGVITRGRGARSIVLTERSLAPSAELERSVRLIAMSLSADPGDVLDDLLREALAARATKRSPKVPVSRETHSVVPA